MDGKMLMELGERAHLRDIGTYLEGGGYQGLRKAVLEMTPSAVLAEVRKAALRGRGGAGFPAGVKWSFLPPDDGGPRYLCVNADEGEPGTFKDRWILGHNPHALLEGMAVAAYAVGARRAFIYIRGEYDIQTGILEKAVGDAREKGFLGPGILGTGFNLEVVINKGAGAYICGEETALLESVEGRRGEPRLKPPFPATVGLFGRPTAVNNVETLSCVPGIVLHGAEWFLKRGLPGDGGTRLFCVSGSVVRPGVYELPIGTSLREVIFLHAGGLPEGKELKAVIPGGLSSPVLIPEEIDVPMDFDSLARAGSMLGSAGVIVIDDGASILDLLRVTARFYAHESCGQCTPCRIGTSWIHKTVLRVCGGRGERDDLDSVLRTASAMKGKTLCPMGDAAAQPIIAFIQKFRSELERDLSRLGAGEERTDG